MPSTPVDVADTENARRLRRPDGHLADVADEHRHAFVFGHHDVLDIAGILNQSDAADHHGLLIVVEQRAARVLIVGADRLGDLSDGQVVFVDRLRIDDYLVLLHQPAEGRHVGDPRHLPEARFDHPIFQVAQFDVAVALAFHHVAVEFADGRGHRAERWGHVVRQGGVAQLFEHHGAREIVVGAVGEGQLHHGESEDGARAARDHAGHAVQRALDGYRDLLFHLLGGVTGIERDHHGLGIRNVGIGLHLKLPEAVHTHADQAQGEHDHHEALVQRKAQQLGDHGLSIGRGGALLRPPRRARRP